MPTSAELQKKINDLDKKIAELCTISNNLTKKIDILKKLESPYQSLPSQWKGTKEATISRDLSQGMCGERDLIVGKSEEGNKVILEYIKQAFNEKLTLQIEFATAVQNEINESQKKVAEKNEKK